MNKVTLHLVENLRQGMTLLLVKDNDMCEKIYYRIWWVVGAHLNEPMQMHLITMAYI